MRGLAVMVLGLAGCAQVFGVPSVSEAQITLDAGDAQTGTVGTALPTPLAVTILDGNQRPMSGFPVTFTVTMASGTVSSDMVTSDSDGNAQVTWTIGTIAGDNRVEVHRAGFSGDDPLVFTATGVAGPATSLVSASGDGQTGVVATALAAPVVVTAQ